MVKKLANDVLDWLDQRNAWQFVGILYLARWVVLVPVGVLIYFVFSPAQQAAAAMPKEWRAGAPLGLFLGLVVIPPVFETLVECTLPYWIVSQIRNYRRSRPKRCWGFIALSAGMMGMLHPIPAAVPAALITGVFLAYCYAHFAAKGIGKALLATAVFHAAINFVGWTILMVS
jgi:hypothetical protein